MNWVSCLVILPAQKGVNTLTLRPPPNEIFLQSNIHFQGDNTFELWVSIQHMAQDLHQLVLRETLDCYLWRGLWGGDSQASALL